MIHARTDGLDLDVEKWVGMLPAILRKYNNTKHSTTGMTPNEAKQEDNTLKVWLNIRKKSEFNEFNRKYPPLKLGDSVRIYEPPKHKKGYKSVWSSKVYKITFMNEKGYQIYGFSKRKVFQRNELLKIEGDEGKDG